MTQCDHGDYDQIKVKNIVLDEDDGYAFVQCGMCKQVVKLEYRLRGEFALDEFGKCCDKQNIDKIHVKFNGENDLNITVVEICRTCGKTFTMGYEYIGVFEDEGSETQDGYENGVKIPNKTKICEQCNAIGYSNSNCMTCVNNNDDLQVLMPNEIPIFGINWELIFERMDEMGIKMTTEEFIDFFKNFDDDSPATWDKFVELIDLNLENFKEKKEKGEKK